MDETIRETSPGAAKRLETSIHDISPRKAGIASVRPNLQKSVSMIESAGITQILQNSLESARSSRISKIPSNQPDSPNQLDPRIRRIPAHGFPLTSHHPPQLATARGPQPGRDLHRRKALRTSSGSWGIDRAGPEPFLVTVVWISCVLLWTFSLRPQAF